MTKKRERLAVFGFGVVFIAVMLILAIRYPEPTPSQYENFRVVLALAAAGIAAFIPGFLEVNVSGWIRAGGALAVFVLVLMKTPAGLIVDGPLALSLGRATSNAGDATLDFGRIPPDAVVTVTVEAANLAPKARTVSLHSNDRNLSAQWIDGGPAAVIPRGEQRSFEVKLVPAGKPGGRISLREGDTTLRELRVAFEVVPLIASLERSSGPRASGRGGDFSPPYSLCLGPAPAHYSLVRGSVRFRLTGDRTCGSWSHCDPVSQDDSDVCYAFSMQGRSEDGSARSSEGHLRADYQLKPPSPALR